MLLLRGQGARASGPPPPITPVGPPQGVQTTGTGSLVATLNSVAYAPPVGDNKRLVVAIHLWAPTSNAFPTAPACSFGGVPMTIRATSQSNNANGGNNSASTVFVFDLVIGSQVLPGVISAGWAGSQRATMVAFTLIGVDQSPAAPAIITSQSIGPDVVPSSATGIVIDFASNDAQNTVGAFALAVGAGQTQLSNGSFLAGTVNEGNLASSYETISVAPSTAMSWTGVQSLGPRSQHVVMAYPAFGA
jgi:hypothetical protein